MDSVTNQTIVCIPVQSARQRRWRTPQDVSQIITQISYICSAMLTFPAQSTRQLVLNVQVKQNLCHNEDIQIFLSFFNEEKEKTKTNIYFDQRVNVFTNCAHAQLPHGRSHWCCVRCARDSHSSVTGDNTEKTKRSEFDWRYSGKCVRPQRVQVTSTRPCVRLSHLDLSLSPRRSCRPRASHWSALPRATTAYSRRAHTARLAQATTGVAP